VLFLLFYVHAFTVRRR